MAEANTAAKTTDIATMFEEFCKQDGDLDGVDIDGIELPLDERTMQLMQQRPITSEFLTVFTQADRQTQENVKTLYMAQLPRERAEATVKDHKEILLLQTELAVQETKRLEAEADRNRSKIAEPETEILKAKEAVLQKEIELETMRKRPHEGPSDHQSRSKVIKSPKASMQGLQITRFFAERANKVGRPGLYITVVNHIAVAKTWKLKDFDTLYGITALSASQIRAMRSEDFVAEDSAKNHESGKLWAKVKAALCE